MVTSESKHRYRETDRYAEKQNTDRQTDRQTNKQTGKRHADIQ